LRKKANGFSELLEHLTSLVKSHKPLRYKTIDEPLRAELFSVEQLEHHAAELAKKHRVSKERGRDFLLGRLSENERVLTEAHRIITKSVARSQESSPADRWFLDNFYLIKEQILAVRQHLPKGYSQALPRLSAGPMAGYPRVYDIIFELVSHVDGRTDMQCFVSFVMGYQSVTPLSMGELWAIPIMLRLSLIENLRRIIAHIISSRDDWASAKEWVDRLLETAEQEPGDIILLMAELARAKKLERTPFIAEFTRRLQHHSQNLSFTTAWVEQHLSKKGITVEQVVQNENRQQAADQVSIENSINSMRFVDEMDWHTFTENVSIVEQVLREDFSDTYANMNFASRDRYRHIIENIARQSGRDEVEVAKISVNLARESTNGKDRNNRRSHVGYYLVDKGLPDLEKAAGVHLSFSQKVKKSLRKLYYDSPLICYLGVILLLTSGGAIELLAPYWQYGISIPVFLVLFLFSFLALSQVAIELVNRIVTMIVPPQYLPRMDFSEGIPSNARTLVVIPTLLVREKDIESLIHQLEIRYMGNRDSHLHFALLTDFADAPDESMPDDEKLLATASEGIEYLNKKYREERTDAFFLFHRPRRFNPQEQVWMGYERKRGKLVELNAFLRGKKGNGFSKIVGDSRILRKVKYVLTLDTDTQLPNGSARELVSIAEHPLNRPQYDQLKHRIIEGYGVLQPRVGVSFLSANRSLFARIFSGDPRFDPYTRAISDVYQDLFNEGSFIGKGLYDVDMFSNILEGLFPANRILSHDLLEGCYLRTALISDVLVYENFPSTYNADVYRRQRWIRGDWQIAAWLFPYIPGPNGTRTKNHLSGLSRWKILDNLRRSLVPPALLIMLLTGWIWTGHLWFWTAVVAGIILGPSIISATIDLPWRKQGLTIRFLLHEKSLSIGRNLVQTAFTLIFLPYEVYICLNAIFKTMVRLLFTHRGLLQWTTAETAEKNALRNQSFFWRTMWIAPFTTICISTYLLGLATMSHPIPFFLMSLWFFCPLLAWWISLPKTRRKTVLSQYHTEFLRKFARKTWLFFETFVGDESNWLPPDNYQEYPSAKVAERTSPTNIGFLLLSNLSAYDFGYISVGELLERTKKTLHTMERMDRFHGHFYNWYDIITLKPLPPLYVSTVDSGNLQYFLLILRQGLLELPDREIIPTRTLDGLVDNLNIFLHTAEQSMQANMLNADSVMAAMERLVEVRDKMDNVPRKMKSIGETLSLVLSDMRSITRNLNLPNDSEILLWAGNVERFCLNILNEIESLTPCMEVLPNTKSVLQGISQEALDELKTLLARMENIQTLNGVVSTGSAVLSIIDRIPVISDETDPEMKQLADLRRKLSDATIRAQERVKLIGSLARQCYELARMDYDLLYNKSRNLLAVGFNAGEHLRDSSYYDLLASEARLGSFLLIAQGKLPLKHWFSLGRLVTAFSGEPVLLSWSGSLFEYLMPLLVMPDYENTLLNQTYRTVVECQIKHGLRNRIPWGFSESGYNLIDAHKNYLYSAFGVPGLGLKRGLGENLVVAPYASALALIVKPENACQNLQRLAREGSEGKYGFYEAVDYTRGRVARGETKSVVRSFMSHHQGMTLLSAAYVLLNHPMQRRFEGDAAFRSAELLLQEKIPDVKPFFPKISDALEPKREQRETCELMRVFNTPDTPTPELHLLSNANYHVMITNAGGGYSRWKNTAVTRWREDTTCDSMGTFFYVRDVDTGELWSVGFHPVLHPSKNYEAIFSQARAEFRQQDHHYRLHTEIAVSPEEDVELRRINITNTSRKHHTVELTSYAEVVLAPYDAEATHPVFNGLFLETEILHQRQAILCRRRPRSDKEQPLWLAHLATVHNASLKDISYETDRARFIGRGKTLRNPDAATSGKKLSNSEGSVLDPVVAIKVTIDIEPEQTASVDMIFGIAQRYDDAIVMVGKYHDKSFADRIFALACTHSQVILHQLGITESDAQLFGRLAGTLIYPNIFRRADPELLARNRRSQAELWGYGISGDLPILLLRISDESKFELVEKLVDAHIYWRIKGLPVDFIIWNEDQSGYRQILHDRIMALLAGTKTPLVDTPGGIFLRRSDQIADTDKILMQTSARIIITDIGSIAEQMERQGYQEINIPEIKPSNIFTLKSPEREKIESRSLIFKNGIGGFTPDGREYVITTSPHQQTPAPWVNVLANPSFGTIVSESGTAYTWSENAHEFRLTPWHNDPVTDSGGEAFYIRDEETGRFWSPAPLPARGKNPYVSRHGFGYSVFEYADSGISSEMWTYVDINNPVKFISIKVRNKSERKRKISVTGYMEPVMGQHREKSQMHIVSEIDTESRAFFARNPFNIDFPKRVFFFEVNVAERNVTGDRTEFIGRNGCLEKPSAMRRMRLSGKTGAGLDPCAALQVQIRLKENEEREIVFILGAGKNAEEARELVRRFREPTTAKKSLEQVQEYWEHMLGTVQLETPDRETDILANGWLLYQTLACRIWARSGFYQSSGAIGFRDQLQDVMSLVHADPDMVRRHILLCASRQFKDGDVQHWWHPPAGRGVRTRISDDFLWLPFVTEYYVKVTGDNKILDEQVTFLQGRPLNQNETNYYDLPEQTGGTGTLYEHCVRAIKNGLRYGSHGLPLIGSGDWNDSLDQVGENGKGESVWLGFFLYSVLTRFSKIAGEYGDKEFAQFSLKEASRLKENLDKHAWDGEWYRRAYLDNGEPLGSSSNDECKIDSISQSWAVLSGAGSTQRSHSAMESVKQLLIKPDSGLILLLTPPFNKSPMNPGYIKGYLPGVRENGGQYTHAAVWTIMAIAQAGEKQRAWELFAMINPITHSKTWKDIQTYKVEPYVVAADVYSVPPVSGRGGWTWYTGSAGWMYRLILESLLGVTRSENILRINPSMPEHWKSFKIHYRYGETVYHINVVKTERNERVVQVKIDGVNQEEEGIQLIDDRREHTVEVTIS